MKKLPSLKHYDVIVVGSGSGGATVANELAREGKSVLILEQGGDSELKESFLGLAPIFSEVKVTPELKSQRAVTSGGSTAVWAAEVELPPLPVFKTLGIDLSEIVYGALSELPVAELPDELISPQSRLLHKSATGLGYDWTKNLMMIDQNRARGGYSYDAKWKARNYVETAVKRGADLVTRAQVTRVTTSGYMASGVEFKRGRKRYTASGDKVILAAGAAATPGILRESGIQDVVNHGFYCTPGFIMVGTIPSLNATDSFVGCMDTVVDDRIVLGDANLSKTLYKLLMLGSMKLKRLHQFSKSIAIGGLVMDDATGELTASGHYSKSLNQYDHERLNRAKTMCLEILEGTGAREIEILGPDAGVMGGVLRIGEHVDSRLETAIPGLYVCDGSILPPEVRLHPTFTLICLGKYLSKALCGRDAGSTQSSGSPVSEYVIN